MARHGLMRIGELSRRTGMAEATLRAWERRYGLPRPHRTVGGHRLYSEQDVVDIQRARRMIEDGWSVHAAVSKVARESLAADGHAGVAIAAAMVDAVETHDAVGVGDAFDRGLAALAVPELCEQVIAPTLRKLHDKRSQGERDADVSFAAMVLESRLMGLLADLQGGSRGVVVACSPKGETFRLPNLLGSVVLAHAGYHVLAFGADLEPSAIFSAVERSGADLLFVTAHHPQPARDFLDSAVPDVPVLAGGRGFREVGGDASRRIYVYPGQPTGLVPFVQSILSPELVN